MATYHAFHHGKKNQSFKMEDEHNQSVYEANLVKFSLLSASDYEFVNCVTSASSSHKVGKTKSMEQGAAGVSMTTASYFNLDGKNCFNILEENGYSIKLIMKLNLLHPEFALIDQAGNQVAVYKMNVVGEKEEGVLAIGNKQSNTVIETESDNLDIVFLGAFIMSRVDFSLYLL